MLMPSVENLGSSDYRLKTALVSGPVGTRWIARASTTGIECVADLVLSGNDDYLKSICENALRTKGWTQHPAVANVLGAGWLPDGQYFQILEMSPRVQSLADAAHAVSESELVRIAQSMHGGLLHMQKRELVHGALSPRVVYRDGESIKIADLWWAHNADGDALYGQFASFFPDCLPDFAVRYAAPEVLRGVPPRREADLYSFGSILFFLLTGDYPREFSGTAFDEQSRARLADAPVKPLTKLRPDVSERTANLVQGLLARKPAERLDIFILGTVLRQLSGQPEPEGF